MATFTPNDITLTERTREAWSAYRDRVAELEGREYETAEAESWERLQLELGGIEADRAALSAEAGADG